MAQWQTSVSRWPVAESLGWLSVGLGLTALFAPRQVSRLTGLDRHGLIRLVGARELASGAGLLTQSNKIPWLWARVAGDVIDLAALGLAHTSTARGRSRAIGAAAVVAAIAAADLAASVQYTAKRSRAGAPDLYFDRTIIVNRTPRECYDYWRDLRNVARFTQRLERVTPLDERRSHWIMKVPGGANLEWVAEITEDKPGERLRWRSAAGAPIQHAGSVTFEPAPGGRGTFVSVAMHYHTPGGSIGAALGRLLGPDPFGEVRENLRRFKHLMETGEIPTTAGQPAGPRSWLGRLLPEGRRSSPRGERQAQASAQWRPAHSATDQASRAPGSSAQETSQQSKPNNEGVAA